MCLEMDVDEEDARRDSSIQGEEQQQQQRQRQQRQIGNLDANNNNNNNNNNTPMSSATPLAGSSLKKRRRVSVVEGVEVEQDLTASRRATTRPRVPPPSSTTNEGGTTTKFPRGSVYTITPSPSMLSVVTYEAASASMAESSTGRGIHDFDSSSSISSSSSNMETRFPPVKSYVIPSVNRIDSPTTTLHADLRRQPPALSSSGLPPRTTLPIPLTHNGTSHPVETVPSTKSPPATLPMVIVHDVFLLASILFLVVLILQGIDMYSQWSARLHFSNDECIYVTGGGFSGFWFSLGRLHSLPRIEMTEQRFACYSAGCLGVVAVYANHTMPNLYRMASGLQREWNQGTLNRYHVVEDFVDQLLEGQSFEPAVLQSLYILTSVPEAWGFRTVMRQPTTMEDLGLMLRQSAWIPLATGSSYTLEGHMDGGFSVFQHPTCRNHVGLANDWNLITNTLNVNLGEAHVQQFWQLGLDYGI